MEFQYIIKFENSHGLQRVIGKANSIDKCWKIIFDFLKERHFESHYQRCHIREGVMWIDVGSHTEFFYVARTDGDEISWYEMHGGMKNG